MTEEKRGFNEKLAEAIEDYNKYREFGGPYNYPVIYIRNRETGEVHRYGTYTHDLEVGWMDNE